MLQEQAKKLLCVQRDTKMSAEDKPAVNTEVTALIENKVVNIYHINDYYLFQHSSIEVVRWEEGKKWQHKIELLMVKLSEKNKEVVTSEKKMLSLREMISRYILLFGNGCICLLDVIKRRIFCWKN